VWLFDALYAQTDRFLKWMDTRNGRLIDIYTEHGGTKERTEELIALLKKRETPVFVEKELAASRQTCKPIISSSFTATSNTMSGG